MQLPANKMMSWVAALLALAALPACQVERERNFEFAPWINHMFFSQAAESYAESPVNAAGKPIFANGRVMQDPPMGTVPNIAGRQSWPLHFASDDAGRKAAEGLKNPFEGTPANLARGHWGFTTYCAPCHNANGDGAGTVAKKAGWAFPLATKDSKVNSFSDGTIFHIVSYGRGNMPSYATQVSQEDRWKIILHLRQLQKAAQ